MCMLAFPYVGVCVITDTDTRVTVDLDYCKHTT